MDISAITDIVAIAILVISSGVALFRGFIKEVLTILGIIGGMAMAFFFGDNMVPIMEGWLGVVDGETPKKMFDLIPYDLIAKVLAYASVLITFVIVLNIISHFLSKAVSSAGLGPIDRTLGVVFGIIRGVLVCGIIYLPVHLMAPQEKKDEWFKDSNLVVYLDGTASWLSRFLPQSTTEETEGTRELLENMDVLKSDKINQETTEIINEYDVEGYNEKARKGLEQLINENTESANTKNYNE